MKKVWTILFTGFAMLAATPAGAQAVRTWVSGVGDDVNPCSRTAPCKTFAGAISKTADGGEINVLDPGGFGAVTITKSITIRSDGVNAGILVGATNGVIVNAAGARVVLDGLDFEGLVNAGQASLSGVRIIAAGEVVIANSDIRNFGTAGVSVDVATGKTAVTLDKVRVIGSNVGVLVQSASGRSTVRIVNSLFTGNANASIRVSGLGNRVFIGNNQLLDPVKGLDLIAGGAARSFGTNTISAPASDAPTIAPQG